jgi:hypothetical protein
MAYLGNTPTTQSFISGTDYFNGTGAQTAFTLTRTVASVNDIEAVVNNVVQQPNDAYNISGTTITFTSAPSAGTNNVYVRYLSTTTQAITPSQNTVGWAQLNADTQQDLGISFKNRIINGNMAIAQRGTSLTNPNGYTLDRWLVATGVASTVIQQSSNVPTGAGFNSSLFYNQGASTWTPTGTQWNSLAQSIEGFNVADLMWGTANAKTVTLSFWVYASLTGTYAVSLNNATTADIGSATVGRSYVSTFTVSTANTWQQVSITVAGDTTGTWLTTNGAGLTVVFSLGNASGYNTATTNAWQAGKFLQTSGSVSLATNANSTFYITGVQLEVGTQATTFTLAGGSYGAELALCQRYFEVHVCGGNNTGIMPMSTGSATSGRGTYVFKVQKRANPSSVTFLAANQYLYQGAGLNAAPSGIAIAVASPSALLIDVTISGATTNATANLLENSTAGANMISISAEL